MAAVFADSSPRKASKEVRRHQLIEATIDTLARKGFSELTLADVAKTAGLSVGIVNFHFETKERLLVETLKALAEDYRSNWQDALKAAGPHAAHKLASLLAADFNESVCTPRTLAAWCAFWAEAQSRPTYQEHCATSDAAYSAIVLDLCRSLIAEGGYPHDPVRTARALEALLEGIWLDLMTAETSYGRDEALGTISTCLHAFFPRHFGRDGTVLA
jgi:TetR/AcrR family transcriptional repressor of bet genes